MSPAALHRVAILDAYNTAIAMLDARIAALVAGCPWLAEAAMRLRTIRGAGVVNVATLMVERLDLRRFSSGKAIAAFMGAAPSIRQSGTSVQSKGHMDKRGNAAARSALYLAALSAPRGASALGGPKLPQVVDAGTPPKVTLWPLMVCLGCFLCQMRFTFWRVPSPHRQGHLPSATIRSG